MEAYVHVTLSMVSGHKNKCKLMLPIQAHLFVRSFNSRGDFVLFSLFVFSFFFFFACVLATGFFD